MKKVLSLLLAAAMVFTFGACAPKEKAGTETPDTPAQQQTPGTPAEPETPEAPAEKIDIRVAALKGPTAMGMVKLMDDAEKGEGANNYIFTLAGAPDELTGPIIQGEFDIAAVPTNLAAVLYNKTEGKVKLAALNTLGVLYVVERGDTIQSVADLKGKTIYSSGQGAVPEYALNYVLEKNGLKPGEDVTVEYKSEHAEIATLLAAGNAQVALLPQPFVTATLAQNENLRVALDLTEAWDAATGGEDFEAHVTHHYEFLGDRLIIGKFCAIGKGVEFVMNGANHRMASVTTYPFNIFAHGWEKCTPSLDELPLKGDTVVGNDVWMGQHVTVLPGAHIGDGAIIGANSVVSGDIPPYTIAAGNPCRVIRPRFDRELTDYLLKLRWWDWEPEKIFRNLEALCSGDLEQIPRIEP